MVPNAVQVVVIALVVWFGLSEVIPMKLRGAPLFSQLAGLSLAEVPMNNIVLGHREIPWVLCAEFFPRLLKVLRLLGQDGACGISFMSREHLRQLSQLVHASLLD